MSLPHRTGCGEQGHVEGICAGGDPPFTVLPGSRRDDAKGTRPPSSSGLGPRPFTAVARVRIPLGVRTRASGRRLVQESGFVPSEASWRSWLARRPVTAEVAGSSPVEVAERSVRSEMVGPIPSQGSVAQLVERSTENRKVTGSTPVGATAKALGTHKVPRASLCPEAMAGALRLGANRSRRGAGERGAVAGSARSQRWVRRPMERVEMKEEIAPKRMPPIGHTIQQMCHPLPRNPHARKITRIRGQ